jgi:hypothetical protein
VYFDYFLDPTSTGLQAFRTCETARVYIGLYPVIWEQLSWICATTTCSTRAGRAVGFGLEGSPTSCRPWCLKTRGSKSSSCTTVRASGGGRVDLSRYAGMSNLQFRFDFTTAGSMPDPNGQLSPPTNNDITRWPPNIAPADVGKEFLFENNFGDLTHPSRGQNNDFEGFYVDNIIVGAAERGELVINAPVDSNPNLFFTPPAPVRYDPSDPAPSEVLIGPYQLEIRRGAEYGMHDGGNNITQSPILLLDTNERLIPDKRLATPIPVEDFEPGFDPSLPWSGKDDARWSVTDLSPAGGSTLGAGSGAIGNGESSGLEVSVLTGGGNLTFDLILSSSGPHVATVPGPFGFPTTLNVPGDFFRLYIDGRGAPYTGNVSRAEA